jgi:hypothetical protein
MLEKAKLTGELLVELLKLPINAFRYAVAKTISKHVEALVKWQDKTLQRIQTSAAKINPQTKSGKKASAKVIFQFAWLFLYSRWGLLVSATATFQINICKKILRILTERG